MLRSSPVFALGRRVLPPAMAAAFFISCSDRTPTGPATATERTSSTDGTSGTSIASPRRSAPRGLPARVGNDPSVETWGGVGVALTVDSAGTHLQFDCARGFMAPVAFVSGARFAVVGTWEFESPVLRSDLPPPPLPASYAGTVEGETMMLTATVTPAATGSPQILGPFTVVRGQFARLRTCNGGAGR